MKGFHSLNRPGNSQRAVAVEGGVFVFDVEQQNLTFLGGEVEFFRRGHDSVDDVGDFYFEGLRLFRGCVGEEVDFRVGRYSDYQVEAERCEEAYFLRGMELNSHGFRLQIHYE